MNNLIEIKKSLYKDKATFNVALMANNDEAVVNNYILGICNTLALNPNLLDCTPQSITNAAITSATLGVPLDARGYAYLVPFKNQVQFQLSYKGYVHIAKRDLDVDQITSVLVYQDDEFSVDMGMNTINHKPNLESPTYGKVENIKYVYAVVRFKSNTGRSQMFEVMTKKAIDDIRSNAKQDYIWKSHYGEMARKTVIKRLCKHAQLGDTSKFDVIDNALDQGKIINVNPEGIIEAEDLLAKDQAKIIEAIESAQDDVELTKVSSDFREKIEEISCYNVGLSKGIKAAYTKKENELYKDKIKLTFEGCEDEVSLDQVYKAHTVRIERLKAGDRNEIEEHYCNLKQRFIDRGIPLV